MIPTTMQQVYECDLLSVLKLNNKFAWYAALGAVGVCMFRQGEPSEAQQASIESLAILRQVLPEKHPEIASGIVSSWWMAHMIVVIAVSVELAQLGNYCRVMGQYAEAEEFLKELLAVRRACLPTAHPLVAQGEFFCNRKILY